MLPSELIERKRDGQELEPDLLHGFFADYMEGRVADYQMSAFLMAVLFRGLRDPELDATTKAILDSGRVLDFSDGRSPAVDKHSTGGVGDKVSLVLSPLLAEVGLRVPMISGRGLGHTGGTVDKLESIPGFRTALSLDEFSSVLDDVGCAMIRQTEEIAPLDGRLYALRDVTGTVPSIPLIASSIISKKVAEGIEALVLDVKCGSGAFMQKEKDAIQLARTLVDLSFRMGLRCVALVTDMETPLGRAVGNALEVREAVECLHGGGPSDVREVVIALAAEAMVAADVGSREDAARRLAEALDDGSAARRFASLVERQGGDPAVVDDPDRLPVAPVRREQTAATDGTVMRANARKIGLAAVELGAGRVRLDDDIDPAVGVTMLVEVGDRVKEGQPLVEIHAASDGDAARALGRLERAVVVGEASEQADTPASRLRFRVTREAVEPI